MTAPLHIYNLIFLSSAWSDVMCKTTAQADIVLLVDGSWSIGRLNFKTIRAFIARMVGVFDIGPDRVQIGKGVFFFFSQVADLDVLPEAGVGDCVHFYTQVWPSIVEIQRLSGIWMHIELETHWWRLWPTCLTKEETLWQVFFIYLHNIPNYHFIY